MCEYTDGAVDFMEEMKEAMLQLQGQEKDAVAAVVWLPVECGEERYVLGVMRPWTAMAVVTVLGNGIHNEQQADDEVISSPNRTEEYQA